MSTQLPPDFVIDGAPAGTGALEAVPLNKPAAPPSAYDQQRNARKDALDQRRFDLEQQRFAYQQQHGGGANGTGGMSRTQIGQARMKLNGLRAIETQLARVDKATEALDRDGWAGPVWGRVPGTGSLDPESARYDKAISTLGALVRQLTRTPGEGAMSDYESKLAAATLPSRSDNRAAREEAIAALREIVGVTRQAYEETLGGQPGAPTATGGGWGKARRVR